MKLSARLARHLVAALTILVACSLWWPADAVESTGGSDPGGDASPTPAAVASALDAARARVADGNPTDPVGDSYVATTNEGRVAIPDDASGDLVVTGDRQPISLGIPGGAAADAQPMTDGILYQDALPEISVVARATDSGAQILAVLDSNEAPTTLAFPVDAGPDTSLAKNPDGSVSVVEKVTTPDGSSIDTVRGEFAAPWAVDANGVAVETSYEIQGTTLVQHVEPADGTVFPVTADPSFVTGWTGLFVHWSRSEAKVLSGMSLAAIAAALGTLCAGPQAILCVAAAGSIFYALQAVSDATVDYLYDHGKRFTTRLAPFLHSYWEKR